MKKWTKKELEKHISINIKDEYSSAIVVSALYKKLYGDYPKIGLSGFQANGADIIIKNLPV